MPRNDKVVRRMLTTEEAAAHLGTTVRHTAGWSPITS